MILQGHVLDKNNKSCPIHGYIVKMAQKRTITTQGMGI